jgi:ABC-type spermidine/putrescine transport system permease subunit II
VSTPGAPPAAVRRSRRPDPANAALAVWGVLVLVFLFLPIVFIVIQSFNGGRLLLVWDHFGTGAYSRALSDPSIKSAVGVSLRAAAGASVIATVLGTLAGVALARRAGRWTVPFLAILGLTLVTPEIVDAVSLLPWFVWLGTDAHLSLFSNGLARLVIGHSLFATAVVVFIVRARVEGLEESLEEAAADLYATPWRRFRDITVPLMAPAVLAGALMAFTLSLDNTIISAFVQVSGSTPWPVYVFSALRSSLRPEIAAVSTLMLLLTLVALGLVALVLRRSGESSRYIAGAIAGT